MNQPVNQTMQALVVLEPERLRDSARCPSRRPVQARCSAACAPSRSAAPTHTSSPATIRASGRRPSRSSRATSGPARSSPSVPAWRRSAGSVGDRVAGTSHDACGVCQKCVEGRYNLCENYGVAGLHRQYGHNHQGADATYVVHGVKCDLPAARRHRASTRAPSSTRPRSRCTAPGAGGIQPGDTVAILGAGPVGLLGGDAALLMGAGRVIVVGRGRRLARAAELGFETGRHVERRRRWRPSAARPMVEAWTSSSRPPARRRPWRLAMAMLRRGGRCSMVGIPTAASPARRAAPRAR